MTIKELHQLAYRRRMGLVGVLQMCICTWPLEIDATTSTGHDMRCPAHDQLTRAHDVRDPRQCCHLDDDFDGACEIHERQGVLRPRWRRE